MNPALPQPDTGKWPSLALAALVHGLLILFLFFGVRWQNPPPQAVEVSVVDGVPPPPRSAATPEPEPRPQPPRAEPKPAPKTDPKPEPKPVPKVEPKPLPPPPEKPEIVTKPEPVKKPPEKPQPKPEPKPEPPKPKPKPEPKPAPKPEKLPDQADRMKEILAAEDRQRRVDEQKRQAVEHQRQLSEQLAAESKALAAARAGAANKKALADYINKIRVKVRGNIILPPAFSGNPEAVLRVNQTSDGTVLDVHVTKSSGNAALDTAIEKAINKSSPLPPPDDPSVFDRDLKFNFRPLEE